MSGAESVGYRRRGWLIAAAAAGITVLVGVGAWLLIGRGGSEPPVITGPTTTTVAPTTTTTVPPLGVEVLWASSPRFVAVSAEEAWAFGGGSHWSGIAHFLDGAWAWAWLAFDTDLPGFEVQDPGLNVFQVVPQPASGLAMAPDGTVWVAGAGGVFSGVVSVDGVEWTRRFDYAAGGVAVAPDGTVWIGGWDWLARWDGGSWVSVSPDSPEPPHLPEDSHYARYCGPRSGVATSDGEVWMVACEDASLFWLLHYDGATLGGIERDGTTLRDADLWSGIFAWVDVEAAPNGDVWALFTTLRDAGDRWRELWLLGRFDGEVWTTYTPPLEHEYTIGGVWPAMAVGPDGRVWFADEDGLLAFDGTDWTYHLQVQTVTDVDVAPDGTVWYIDEAGPHTLTP